VEQVRYFGTNLTNQNSIHKEIKSILKSGNACYHSVQKLSPPSLLSKYIRIKIQCKNCNFTCCFYGCEAWSLTLREEHRLRVFENRVLSKIFGTERNDVTGVAEEYTKESFMICLPHKI
jgi:hypothetical protein